MRRLCISTCAALGEDKEKKMKNLFRLLCVVSAMLCQSAVLQAATGDLMWTGQIGGDKATWSTPVLYGDLVIIKGQDGGMTALSSGTGAQAWYNADIAASLTSPILLGDGHLYLGADTKMYQINPATGAILIEQTLDGWFSGAAPASLGAHLYYVRSKDGTYYLAGASSATLAEFFAVPIGASPGSVIAGDQFVYAFSDKLTVHNPMTGATAWSVDPPTGYTSFMEGALQGGNLVAFVYSDDTTDMGLACYSLGDGTSAPSPLWAVELANDADVDGIPPVIDGDTVMYGASDGFVRALALASGAPVWSLGVRSPGLAGPRPVALDGKVYVQELSDTVNNALCLDGATGAVLWRTSGTAGMVWGQPAVGGGRVYFAADWAGIFAFNSGPHAHIWPMHKNNPGQTSTAVNNPVPPGSSLDGPRELLLLNEVTE
jgi:outer membrane protein assembly factor BamB